MRTHVSFPHPNEELSQPQPEDLSRSIAWLWMFGTFLGFLAALTLCSLPGVSTYFGQIPQFASRSGWFYLLLFSAMGLVSSLPQWWLLCRLTERAYLWLLLTMLGGLIGAVIMVAIFPLNESIDLGWITYPLFTFIPVSILQSIAFAIFLPVKWKALIWFMVRVILVAVLSIAGGLLALMGYNQVKGIPVITFALSFSVTIGLPLGVVEGKLIRFLFD